MIKKLGILVLSCDKNISLLNIFFDFLYKNWRTCEYPIYVGLEKKQFKSKNVISLNSNSHLWGKRVKEYLHDIKEEFVLIILDDFIIEAPADINSLDYYIEQICKNKNIANISLADMHDKAVNTCLATNHLIKRINTANYLMNLQIGLWRKEILDRLIKPNENPWQTELYGSVRARKYKNYDFLCIKSDNNMPLKYNRGWLIVRGKWNADEIIRLGLQKYDKYIFDGKDINYLGYQTIFTPYFIRLKQKYGIRIRKILSWFGFYL